MSTPEVVVTGLGMTTPVGGDVASTWSAILAGQSGIRQIDAEWIAEQPSRIAGQLAVEPSEVPWRIPAAEVCLWPRSGPQKEQHTVRPGFAQ